MASMAMTASFLAGSAVKHPAAAPRRGLVVAKATRGAEGVNMETKKEEENGNGRRELVFAAAAAAAACSIAKVAVADVTGPKPGTPEARKKYAPICVTMPTAKICRK